MFTIIQFKPAFTKLTGIFCMLLISLIAPLAEAQTKVVVVPMAGEDLKPLKNIVTVAKANGDFSDPLAALASITDASQSNPYLVVIAPGEYILAEPMTMKQWVSVSGSGEAATRLISDFTTDNLIIGLANLANNSILSHLTIENIGGGELSTGVFSLGLNKSARLENVTIIVTGGSLFNRGIYSNSASPTIRNVSSTAIGGGKCYAVQNEGSSPKFFNITAFATDGALTTRAVYNVGLSSPEMVELDALGISPTGWGIYNENGATPIIRRSTIAGQAGSIFADTGTTIKVSQSTIIGVPGGNGTQQCVASDDGNGNAKAADCS